MESFSSSSGNPSPQPSPENLRKQKQTPFLSKLVEKKKSRTLETEENDYTENPMVVGQKGKFVSDGSDMMRRALLLTNSLPDRLQFAIKHNQASEKSRSNAEMLTPPPVPPRPLPCNRIPSGFELRSGRWHERELPLRSQSRSQNVSRVPPPRPPKSASVIALMMTNPHHVNTNNSVPNRPSHSLLRDRRGDVIEVPQSCRLIRSCPKEKATCAITMQPSNISAKAAETERLLPARVNMNPNDEIAEQKRRNKIEAENCELLVRNVPQNDSVEEKPCPHCGKNINEVPFQRGKDEKKKPVPKQDADVERAESLPRCDCSCGSSVEMVTCMWCVKSCFYHCADDVEREENLWADKPCACHGLHCQRRWFYMVFMFFVFPLIILYPLFRLVSDSCCRPEQRKESRKEDRRRQQRNNSNNYTPAPTFS